MENLLKVRSEYTVEYRTQWFENNKYFIAMELCAGSLQNILDSKPEVFGREPGDPMNSLEYYMSCHVFIDILQCLQYLHDLRPPLIHRDVKPDNILLISSSRNGRFFIISDFGLATLHDKSSEKGIPKYLAPEINGKTSYNHKIDIYSLSRICELDMFEIDLDDLDGYV
jgi:serine/threonine protein kinase